MLPKRVNGAFVFTLEAKYTDIQHVYDEYVDVARDALFLREVTQFTTRNNFSCLSCYGKREKDRKGKREREKKRHQRSLSFLYCTEKYLNIQLSVSQKNLLFWIVIKFNKIFALVQSSDGQNSQLGRVTSANMTHLMLNSRSEPRSFQRNM